MGKDTPQKVSISLYEFYAMGINSLLSKSLWEVDGTVSAYKQSFLAEQRHISLTILFLLGEEYVPKDAMQSLPSAAEQVRYSVNQAIFLRALKHYYRHAPQADAMAQHIFRRMESYIHDAQAADGKKVTALEAMTATLIKRVPPRTETQYTIYKTRVEDMYTHISNLIQRTLNEQYTISG